MSLGKMFEPEEDHLGYREGDKYNWTELSGKKQIQAFAVGKTKIGNVDVRVWKHPDKFTDGRNFSYYGFGTPDDCKEAWEYSDGSILMCVTTKCFAGTFASHDYIETNYVGLTPIEGTR